MKRRFGPLLVLAAVLLLAALLNPSPQRHRQEIRQEIGERNPVTRLLALNALAAFASNYHSLGIASYTTAGDRVLSVGVLGMVVVRD